MLINRAIMRTEQNRTEQNRTEQNRTEQNRTEQNRSGNTAFFCVLKNKSKDIDHLSIN